MTEEIEMKTVALVPIKMNSQRVPHKNILKLGKHSLAWYIFDSLLEVKGIDEIYVYCSDETIKNYIPDGVRFLKRDAYLDGDKVKGFEIYIRFINEVDADIYVLSHATSPFVKSDSIQNALNHVLSGKNDSAFSAKKIQTFLWNKTGPLNYDPNDVPRTQDLDPIYAEVGAFYIFRKEIFTESQRRIGFNPYIQVLDDVEGVDIDEPDEFEFAKMIAEVKGI